MPVPFVSPISSRVRQRIPSNTKFQPGFYKQVLGIAYVIGIVLADALARTFAPMAVTLLNHIPVQGVLLIRASHKPQHITATIAGCHTKQRTVIRRHSHGLPCFAGGIIALDGRG